MKNFENTPSKITQLQGEYRGLDKKIDRKFEDVEKPLNSLWRAIMLLEMKLEHKSTLTRISQGYCKLFVYTTPPEGFPEAIICDYL